MTGSDFRGKQVLNIEAKDQGTLII